MSWRSLDSIAYASGTNTQTMAVDDDASVDYQSANIRVRRLFPEVWLFNSTTAGLVFVTLLLPVLKFTLVLYHTTIIFQLTLYTRFLLNLQLFIMTKISKIEFDWILLTRNSL